MGDESSVPTTWNSEPFWLVYKVLIVSDILVFALVTFACCQAGRSSKRQLVLLPGGIERHLKVKTCSVSDKHIRT